MHTMIQVHGRDSSSPSHHCSDPVGVNDSITVSSAWELTSVSMHYSQGNGVHTPLSRLVLYPRSVCVCVCVTGVYKCYIGLPSARPRAVWNDNNKDMCVHHLYLQG